MTINVYPNMTNFVTTSSNESASALPATYQVARGLVTGVTSFAINGYQSALPITNYYPIWENASYYPTYPSSAAVQYLTSSSASDTAVQVLVSGVSSTYAPISETVTLNGTAYVSTVNSYLRINSLNVTSTTSPVGSVTIGPSNSSITTVYATIGLTTQNGSSVSNGRSNMSVYTVPTGFTLYITRQQVFVAAGGSNYGTYRIYSANAGVLNISNSSPIQYPGYSVTQVTPLVYTAGTDVQFQVSVTGSVPVGIQIEGLLISGAAN